MLTILLLFMILRKSLLTEHMQPVVVGLLELLDGWFHLQIEGDGTYGPVVQHELCLADLHDAWHTVPPSIS